VQVKQALVTAHVMAVAFCRARSRSLKNSQEVKEAGYD